MEEPYGASTGATKHKEAIAVGQSCIEKLGWKIDATTIIYAIIAAVGRLHAEQRKVP